LILCGRKKVSIFSLIWVELSLKESKKKIKFFYLSRDDPDAPRDRQRLRDDL